MYTPETNALIYTKLHGASFACTFRYLILAFLVRKKQRSDKIVVIIMTLSHARTSRDAYFTAFQFLTFKVNIGHQ